MTTRLNIGITCFPTFGGSGIVATEIGLAMARRGHKVHFISRALPVRLHPATDGVYFHEVTESAHPVLEPGGAYPLALASKIIEVAGYEKLDLLHVHYAVPHATAAFLARQVLGASAPRLVTTLHGTDITLVGSDPSYLPITRFSVQQSDAVTVPSAFLREETRQRLDLDERIPLEVIPNFVDTDRFAPPQDRDAARDRLQRLFPGLGEQEPVLFHVSNFRPIKRVADVVATLAAVNAQVPSRLVLVGDGPERSAIERKVHDLGLGERVCFLGKQERFEAWLAAADVFVLPSETESFGLAALEALSCGVPVVAADVGGLPEVVTHGVTGWLAPVGDVATFSQRVLDLVRNPQSWQAMSRAARADVLARFQRGPAIDAYEGVYRRVLGQ
jgi:N-acetyl-alpha-D-glucosaminyl L-malate synthase BshA